MFVKKIELTRLNPVEGSIPIDAIPVALSAAVAPAGTPIVTVGAEPNPTPACVMVNQTILYDTVLIEQVAAPPLPPPPVIVIVGTSVYPNPALVINIFSIEVTFALDVVNATAVASAPDKPVGDVLIATVGVPVNPEPSLFKNISRITPVDTTGDARAVIPIPTS